MRLWCVDEEGGRPNTEPMVTQHEKARSINIGASTHCLAARLQLIMQLRSPLPILRVVLLFFSCTCSFRDAHLHAVHAEGNACMVLQRDKVRDVQYNQSLGRIASLVTNGSVQLWDPHLRLAGTVRAC